MKQVCFFIFLFFSVMASSQDTLTLQSAIEIALEKNYDILLVRKQAEESALLNHPGEAGKLPTATAGAADQYSSTNIYQRFATGNEIRSANATGNNLSSFIALDWTVFAGFRLNAAKDKLEEYEKRGEVLLKAQIAQTIFDVTSAYSDHVRLNRLVENTKEIIRFNQERADLAKMTFEAGIGPKTEWSQAEVDLNARKQLLSRLEAEFRAAGIRLNTLLVRGDDEDVLTSREITWRELDLKKLENDLVSSNYDLQLARSLETEKQIMEIEAAGWQYPVVTLSGAYDFVRNDYSAGFSLQNQTYGPSVGINIAIPIYDGGNLRRHRKAASLETEQAHIVMMNTELNAKAEFARMADFYISLKDMIEDQEDNILLAKDNLDIINERFRQGQNNSLEVRQAELSYSTTQIELATLQYELKMVETQLLLLTGQL